MKIGPFEINRRSKAAPVTDLRTHPNARKATDADIEKKKAMMFELVRLTQSLTRDDMNSWRLAWQMAINIETPRRTFLYQHYRNTMVDLHLTGCIIQRKLSVMMKRFKVVNEAGEENEALTKQLKKKWMRQFMNIALETPYYGYTLAQFGDVIMTADGLAFKEVTVVPREHVVPEFNRLLKFSGDYYKAGIDYTQPPMSNWVLGMGERDDLGILLKVTPACISTRHIEAFWDGFAEIFGIPLRIGKTSSRDPKDRAQLEDMLTNMGSAAWGLFPDGTEIEVVEAQKSDSYQVFDARITRAEKRISKAILGTTMTIDDGSSKSQADVHLDMFEKIIEADTQWLLEVINDDLFPLLKLHGFAVDGHKFIVDESKNYEPTELTNVLQVLLQYYDVEEDWLNDRLNIPLLKKAEVQPKPGDPNIQNVLKSFFG